MVVLVYRFVVNLGSDIRYLVHFIKIAFYNAREGE